MGGEEFLIIQLNEPFDREDRSSGHAVSFRVKVVLVRQMIYAWSPRVELNSPVKSPFVLDD